MPSSPALQRWLSALTPWLAGLALLALSELPAIALSQPARICVDFGVLIALYFVSLRLGARVGRLLRIVLLLYTVLLFAFRLDVAAMLAFMGQEPLLYDQLLMVRHLLVLFSDLWTPNLGAALAAIPVVIALIVWIISKLLRRFASITQDRRQSIAGVVVLGLLCIGATLTSREAQFDAVPLGWGTPALLKNIAHSHEIYASVQRQVQVSPYRTFDRLKLGRRPDIYLFFVESYGRVMVDHDVMHARWRSRVRQMQGKLEQAGWSMASAFSVAPVAGGRSWLAEASVLTGIHVDYEAVFHHLVGQIERVPNLVSLLARQGYHTLLLAPSDRVRKGVEETNYYNYKQLVRFQDLDYHGRKIGWGLVPDQYSLGYTNEHVLRTAPHPLFFNYHMVSSHTPFRPVPQLLEDWHNLSDPNAPLLQDTNEDVLAMRMRRYAYRTPRFMPMGKLERGVAYNYSATILYDLNVLERYLISLPGDALVIVMGDHQPPFITAETNNFESIIHLFARDPDLLREFEDHGFKPGLELEQSDQAAVHHEGLFSLIVRALARCCAREPFSAQYRPEGSHL